MQDSESIVETETAHLNTNGKGIKYRKTAGWRERNCSWRSTRKLQVSQERGAGGGELEPEGSSNSG